MVEFQMQLAGIAMRVCARYESTRQFCRDYLTDATPLFQVTITRADIRKEREYAAQTALQEGRRAHRCRNAYLERLALCRKITAELLRYRAVLFHGAVVAQNGKAYMFTAKSGTGKTTHLRLWLKNIPGCYVLNGDKPLLLFREEGVYVCGTPWRGKENYGVNEILPLEAICILQRDAVNHLEPVNMGSVLETLITQTHHPEEDRNLADFIRLLVQLRRIRLYRLGCNMQDEAAWVAYKGIVEEKQ